MDYPRANPAVGILGMMKQLATCLAKKPWASHASRSVFRCPESYEVLISEEADKLAAMTKTVKPRGNRSCGAETHRFWR